jgi:uncharacterized protein (DUF302 family)
MKTITWLRPGYFIYQAMKTLSFTLAFLLALSFQFDTQAQQMVTHESAHDAEQTVSLLKSQIETMDVQLMQHINHSQNAEKAGMDLSPVHVLMFGNPKVGTQLMQTDPEVAVELPLKILVYEKQGKTFISYKDPTQLGNEYDLQNHRDILQKMKEVLEKVSGAAIKQ